MGRGMGVARHSMAQLKRSAAPPRAPSSPALAPPGLPLPRHRLLCSVYCLQAKSVAVNNIDGLAAHGRWVDFGLRSVAVGLHTPEGEEEGAGERPPELEIVEFPLGG